MKIEGIRNISYPDDKHFSEKLESNFSDDLVLQSNFSRKYYSSEDDSTLITLTILKNVEYLLLITTIRWDVQDY